MRLSLAFLLVFGIVGACAAPKASFDDDDGFTSSGTSTGGAGSGGASVNNATVGSTTDAASTVANSVANSTVSTVNTVAASTGSSMNCLQDPDCPQCFCNQDPAGCNDYLNFVITHIYCGQSCGAGACSAFCTSMDPNQIDLNCDNCVQTVSQTDIDAFIADCQASIDCSNFLNQIIMCP